MLPRLNLGQHYGGKPMIIDIRETRYGEVILSETVRIKNFPKDAHYSLVEIQDFELDVSYNDFNDETHVSLNAVVPVTLECAYTLKHFRSVVEINETICFSDEVSESNAELDDCYYEKGPFIDLTPYLFILIISLIPLKVIAPGARLPESEVVLSEEEYLKTKGHRPLADDEALRKLAEEIDD